MAKVNILQPCFVAGELDPEFLGRVDKETYYKGCSLARNVYIRPQGGAFRKEGQRYIATTGVGRKIEFEFNNEQTYLLVFTAGQFKVYKDDVLQATVAIAGLTEMQISEMRFAQKSDAIFLFHNDFQPLQITRTSHTAWTVAAAALTNIPVYPFSGVTVTEPSTTLTPSAVSGRYITVTAGGATFTSAHVGQYLKYKNGGLIRIVGFSSDTVVYGSVEIDLPNTSAVVATFWQLETGYEPVWSVTRGWPGAGHFYQDRLYLGASSQLPSGLWGSVVGEYLDFDLGAGDDDDAIEIFIQGNNKVRAIYGSRHLQIFTSGGEYYIPSDTGKPVTPSSAFPVRTTGYGIGNVEPISVDGVTVFIDQEGSGVQEFIFDLVEESYQSNNISLRAAHLIRNPVRSAVREGKEGSPTHYAYFVNSDGTMAVLNSLRSEQLLAWSLFEEPDAFYEDVCTVGRDVYVTMRRTINGVTVRYIEKLDADYFLSASKIATSGSPTASWSGFAHLNGQSCAVRADGFMLNNVTPSGGNLTTEVAASAVEIGIPFLARVATPPLDSMQVPNSPYTGEWRRPVVAKVKMIETRDIVLKIGDKRYVPTFGEENLTGWKVIPLRGRGRDVAVEITQDAPLEFKILALKVGVR